MKVVISRPSDTHRVEVAGQLMDELQKSGFSCRPDRVTGAFYIDIEGHRGFTLEVEREWVKVDRAAPYEHDYTGRAKIEYQGFGQVGGTTLVEPEGGFDFAAVATTLAHEIAASSQRREAWEAARAQAEAVANSLVTSLADEYFDGNAGGCDWAPTINSEAKQVDGEWRTRLDLELYGLSEWQARQMLDLAKSFQEDQA